MSLDYPMYEEMRRRGSRAAPFWLIGDRLYYAGLLGGIVAVTMHVPSLQSAAPKETTAYAVHDRYLALCAKLGIRTLDFWDLFEDLIRREGSKVAPPSRLSAITTPCPSAQMV